MKTTEEFAVELSTREVKKVDPYSQGLKVGIEFGVENGVEFAQSWISVSEEIPARNISESLDVLLKTDKFITIGYYDYDNQTFMYYTNIAEGFVDYIDIVTHWRPIERS